MKKHPVTIASLIMMAIVLFVGIAACNSAKTATPSKGSESTESAEKGHSATGKRIYFAAPLFNMV